MSDPPLQFGRYRLVEPIGQGGMGEVWRALHTGLSREAAVKLIRPDRLGEEAEAAAAIRRLEREAQATSQLRSQHTIEVYDFGVAEDGTFYYAMELLEGYDLRTLVERFGPVPAERAVHLLLQVCESLAEAHGKGLVHRDIKPANVFVSRLGVRADVAKVLDFGLVKALPGSGSSLDLRLTQTGAIAGSPAYIAPEAVEQRGRDVDARADLYALGCVAFWLLTGRLVFESDDPLAAILAHVREAPPAPSTLSELDVPAELDALILECLAKTPDERPPSAEALARRLEALDLPAWTQDRARRWWDRHPPATSPAPRVESPDALAATASHEPPPAPALAPALPQPEETRDAADAPPPAPGGQAPGVAQWLLLGGLVLAAIVAAVAWPRDEPPVEPDPAPEVAVTPGPTPDVTPAPAEDAATPESREAPPVEFALALHPRGQVRARATEGGVELLAPLRDPLNAPEDQDALALPAGTVLERCEGRLIGGPDDLVSCYLGALGKVSGPLKSALVSLEVRNRGGEARTLRVQVWEK